MADKTLDDFNGDWEAFVDYLSKELYESVAAVAKKNGCSLQQASDRMLDGSVAYARRLRLDRLARSN